MTGAVGVSKDRAVTYCQLCPVAVEVSKATAAPEHSHAH